MFFIGLIVGGLFGAMTMALMAVSGSASRCEECRKKGERDADRHNMV